MTVFGDIGKLPELAARVDAIAESFGFKLIRRPTEYIGWYELVDEKGEKAKNEKGETILISVSYCTGGEIQKTWHRKGWTAELLENWWGLDTYVYDSDGNCYRAYDPTIRKSDDGKRLVVNFTWTLPATEENFEKLLSAVKKRFFEAR